MPRRPACPLENPNRILIIRVSHLLPRLRAKRFRRVKVGKLKIIAAALLGHVAESGYHNCTILPRILKTVVTLILLPEFTRGNCQSNSTNL